MSQPIKVVVHIDIVVVFIVVVVFVIVVIVIFAVDPKNPPIKSGQNWVPVTAEILMTLSSLWWWCKVIFVSTQLLIC